MKKTHLFAHSCVQIVCHGFWLQSNSKNQTRSLESYAQWNFIDWITAVQDVTMPMQIYRLTKMLTDDFSLLSSQLSMALWYWARRQWRIQIIVIGRWTHNLEAFLIYPYTSVNTTVKTVLQLPTTSYGGLGAPPTSATPYTREQTCNYGLKKIWSTISRASGSATARRLASYHPG